jgi:ketosteroid isomerase-like protein
MPSCRALAVVLLSILALLPAPARGQEAPPARLPSVALPAELDRVLRDYERAWQAGDAAALTALFTDDGFAARPTGWARGSDAVRAGYENAGGDLRLRAHAFAAADSVGWIVGSYGYGEEAATVDRGKFVLALRRADDGPWRIVADLDGGNRPR